MYIYSKPIINKIRKKEKYFKYFVFKYRFDNNNIFYKIVNPLIKKQIKIIFKIINIKEEKLIKFI